MSGPISSFFKILLTFALIIATSAILPALDAQKDSLGISITGKTYAVPKDTTLYHGSIVRFQSIQTEKPSWFAVNKVNSIIMSLHTFCEVNRITESAAEFETLWPYLYEFRLTKDTELALVPPGIEGHQDALNVVTAEGEAHQTLLGKPSAFSIPIMKKAGFCKNTTGWRAPWDQDEVMLCPQAIINGALTNPMIFYLFPDKMDEFKNEVAKLAPSAVEGQRMAATLNILVKYSKELCKQRPSGEHKFRPPKPAADDSAGGVSAPNSLKGGKQEERRDAYGFDFTIFKNDAEDEKWALDVYSKKKPVSITLARQTDRLIGSRGAPSVESRSRVRKEFQTAGAPQRSSLRPVEE